MLKNVRFYFILKIIYLFIYLFMRDRDRERQREREKQAPCREPNIRLDPGPPGSGPGLKAGAELLSHLGCPG